VLRCRHALHRKRHRPDRNVCRPERQNDVAIITEAQRGRPGLGQVLVGKVAFAGARRGEPGLQVQAAPGDEVVALSGAEARFDAGPAALQESEGGGPVAAGAE
jgi:hypothetical protein